MRKCLQRNISHLLIIDKAESESLLVRSQFGIAAHRRQQYHVELFTLKLLH